jgi:hypothetical protein
MDVKSVFLNEVLDEEVYVEQPLGYIKSWKGTKGALAEECAIWTQTDTKSL